MVSIKSIRLDTSLESEGVWEDFPYAQGVRFKIASYTCGAYTTAMREAHKAKEHSQKEHERLYAEAVARHLIRDWSGLDEGPYDYAQAIQFCTDPEYKHVRAWVEAVSTETAKYLTSARAEAGKA